MARHVGHHVRHAERGQSLVELAVALPLIVLLMLGLFDAGRVVIGYTTLTNAARVGARVAIVNQSNDATCTSLRTFKCAAAEQAVSLGITAGSVPDLVISGADCALTGSCTVTVTLAHPIDLVTPVVGSLMGPFTLSASTTMPIERTYASP
jgi:Flp pilus assembly protein TadG